MNLSLAELSLPVHLRPETAMTDDELLRFCAVNDAVRIEREPNGELFISPLSGCSTSIINVRLTRLFGEWAEADARGICFANAGFVLQDGSMRATYIAWLELCRWNDLSQDQRERFAPLCPDFLIELRSPSDTLPPLHRKMQQWIDNGAQVAWLIDPIDRVATVYRPGQPPEHHQNPTSLQGTGPVAGFELVFSRLWGK